MKPERGEHSRYFQLMKWQVEWLPHLTTTAAKTLVVLSSYVGRGDLRVSAEERRWSVFPTESEIATRAGFSERSAQAGIAELRKLGLLKTYSRGKAQGYILRPDTKPSPEENCHPKFSASSPADSCIESPAETCVQKKTINSVDCPDKSEDDKGKSPPAPPPAKEEAPPGKSKKEEDQEKKIARVRQIAADHGHLLPASPSLYLFWRQIESHAGDPEALLPIMFGEWTSFKHVAVDHGAWWFEKHPNVKPVPNDLVKNGVCAVALVQSWEIVQHEAKASVWMDIE